MPKRCVAANCSNVTKDQIRLYRFPKDPELREKWASQVRRTRADWGGPTPYSFLCSEHFEKECFDSAVSVKESLGFGARNIRNLISTAIPTIFIRHQHDTNSATQNTGRKSNSKALEKRERSRVTFYSNSQQQLSLVISLHKLESVLKAYMPHL